MTSGVLIVDKPRGPTSHDVVARIRKAVKSRHVGHAGTLDPMATGVLVVAVGEGTKLVPWLTAADKEYVATIRLGIETDTLDAEGRITNELSVPASLPIEGALTSERARREQVPPAYSAIRIAGERAHDLARSGRLDGDLPARPIEVRALEVVTHTGDLLTVRVAAAKGYFVRALARDLARALGTCGHLVELRRTKSGAFTVEDAIALEDVSRERFLTIDVAAARALPVSVLDEAGALAAFHGQPVRAEHLRDPHETPSAWLDTTGRLVAVGEWKGETGQVLRGFPAP